MKFLLCVPVDLEIPDTKRATIKSAAKRLLVDLARNPDRVTAMMRTAADTEDFLARAPEPTYAERAAK